MLIMLLIAACGGSPVTETDSPAPTMDSTALAQAVEATVAAKLTQTALENPTATEAPPESPTQPEPTLPPTAVPSPSPTIPVSTFDDHALFLEDVSIPDGTEIIGGEDFVKTWRIQNIGLETWTKDYAFVFVNGERMEGFPISLDREVVPGGIIDISIPMTAPLEGGAYTGYWMFTNADDAVFGIGDGANQAVVVSIFVIEPTPVPTATPTLAPTATATP